MIGKTSWFWLAVLCVSFCSYPYTTSAQAQHTSVTRTSEYIVNEFDRRAAPNAFLSADEGVFISTPRNGCFYLPYAATASARSLLPGGDRKNKITDLLWLNGAPCAIINHQSVLSLEHPNKPAWPLMSPHISKTVTPVDMAVMSDGALAMATANDGVFIFGREGPEKFANIPLRISTIEQALPSNVIHTLFVDSDGILWIGTDAGLAAHYQGRTYNLSETPEQAPLTFWQKIFGRRSTNSAFQKPVTAIAQWGNSLFFTSQNKLHKAARKLQTLEQVHTFSLPPEILADWGAVNALQVDFNNRVWIAASPLLRYDIATENWTILKPASENTSNVHLCLVEDPNYSRMLVGTKRRGLFYIQDQ